MYTQDTGSGMVRVRARCRVLGWSWDSGKDKGRDRVYGWVFHGGRSRGRAVSTCKCNDTGNGNSYV